MKATRSAVPFPYKPKAVGTCFDAQIIEIKRVFHHEEPPQDGYSKDYWLLDCIVKHSDGKITTGTIEPSQMVYTAPEGHEEINLICGTIANYLDEHGTWNHRTNKKPQGWTAHRKAKQAA